MCQPALTFCYRGIEHKATRAGFSVLYCTNKVSIRLWMWIYAASTMSWIFLFDSDRYCAFEMRQITRWMSTFAWLHLWIEKHGWLQCDITKSLETSLLKCHWIPRGVWDNWLISPQVFFERRMFYYWGYNTGFSGKRWEWKWKLKNSVSEQNRSLFKDINSLFYYKCKPFFFHLFIPVYFNAPPGVSTAWSRSSDPAVNVTHWEMVTHIPGKPEYIFT